MYYNEPAITDELYVKVWKAFEDFKTTECLASDSRINYLCEVLDSKWISADYGEVRNEGEANFELILEIAAELGLDAAPAFGAGLSTAEVVLRFAEAASWTRSSDHGRTLLGLVEMQARVPEASGAPVEGGFAHGRKTATLVCIVSLLSRRKYSHTA